MSESFSSNSISDQNYNTDDNTTTYVEYDDKKTDSEMILEPNSEKCYSDDEENYEENEEVVEEENEELSEMEKNAITTNEKLFERLKTLHGAMSQLKTQLQEERELWQKEVDEIGRLNETANNSLEVLNRGEEFMAEESMTSIENDQDVMMFGSTENVKEYTISEYEQKLAKYQEALARAQAEKRASLQRQIAISNYKRRLLEVENMCNMELLRVKQNVQFLQPLQLIASEWNKEQLKLKDHGDEEPHQHPQKEQLSLPPPDSNNNNSSSSSKECVEMKTNNSKDQAPIETLGNRLYNEMNEMFYKISTQCYEANLISMNSTPSATTSSIWPAEEELGGNGKIQRTLWYSM